MGQQALLSRLHMDMCVHNPVCCDRGRHPSDRWKLFGDTTGGERRHLSGRHHHQYNLLCAVASPGAPGGTPGEHSSTHTAFARQSLQWFGGMLWPGGEKRRGLPLFLSRCVEFLTAADGNHSDRVT